MRPPSGGVGSRAPWTQHTCVRRDGDSALSDPPSPPYCVISQAQMQLVATLVSLVIALGSGALTGSIVKFLGKQLRWSPPCICQGISAASSL